MSPESEPPIPPPEWDPWLARVQSGLREQARDSASPLSRYIRLRELGRGGMGVVYLAQDQVLQRSVALKFLTDPHLAKSFLREGQMVAQLSHPNIIAVHEVGETDGTPFLAMEYIEGKTLDLVRLGPRRVAELSRDVATALHHAHTKGIVHRDIKPRNLILGDDGRVRVLDFGLAKQWNAASSISGAGRAVGTPNFMAPEQVKGGPCDARTDVYGLGATMYELLAGRPPFHHEHVPEVMRKILEEDPPPIRKRMPEVDGDLETIVRKCLEKEPNRRYTTASELARDLERWCGGEPIAARPASWLYRSRKRILRRSGTWALGALFVVAAAVGVYVVASLLHVRSIESRAQELVVRAERSYAASEYAETRKLAEEALRLAPGHREARYWLARLKVREYQERRGIPPTRVVFGRMEVVPPRPETPEERSLRMSIERDLRDVPSPIARGILALWSGNTEEALREFESVPKDAAGAWEADFYAGIACYLAGRFTAAVDRISRHRGREPSDTLPVLIRSLLAVGKEREGRGEDVKAAYVQAHAASLELGGGLGRVLEAQVLVALGRLEASRGMDPEERFAEALRKVEGIEDVDAYLSRGDALLARADYRSRRGKLSLEDPKEYREAIEAYGEAIRLYGFGYLHRAEAAKARWDFLSKFGRSRMEELKAIRMDYRMAAEQNPHDPQAGLGLALTEEEPGDESTLPWREEKMMEEIGEVIASHPDYAPAYVLRGKISLVRGDGRFSAGEDPFHDYERGLADLNHAIGLSPGVAEIYLYRAQMHYARATYRYSRGENPIPNFLEMILDCDRASALHSQEGLVLRGRSRHYLGLYRRGEGQDPASDFRAALEDFSEALTANPQDSSAFRERGYVRQDLALRAREQGEDPTAMYREALEDVSQALSLNPLDWNACWLSGLIHQNLGSYHQLRKGDPTEEFQRAIDDCSRALEIQPSDPLPFIQRGKVRHLRALYFDGAGLDPLEEFQWALQDFGVVIARNSRDQEARRNRGSVLASLAAHLQRGEKDPTAALVGAIEDFGIVFEGNPRERSALEQRFNAYRNLALYRDKHGADPTADYKAAGEDLERLAQLNPKDGAPYRRRGILYELLAGYHNKKGLDTRRDHEEAIRDFNRALERNKEDMESLRHRGRIRTLLGLQTQNRGGDPTAHFLAAIADYDGVLERNPKEARILRDRGSASQYLGDYRHRREDYEKAEGDFSQAIAADPADAQSRLYRGQVRWRLGRAEEALEDLQSAAKLDPSLAEESEKWIRRVRGEER